MGAVFMGTPAAAVPSLAALGGIEDIDLVITQPDRRSGRGGVRTPSAVKVAAGQWGLPVAQPENRTELLDILLATGARFGLVVAYGRILTPAMLASADAGFLNVHFSLLPRWRGAAPVERSIAAGDEMTGVTLMKLDEGLDTGPIIGETSTPIGPYETGGTLTGRLAHLGAALVDAALPDYLSGRRSPVPQIDTDPTHANRLTTTEARVLPTWDAARAERCVRAFTPRPGARLETPDGGLRIWSARRHDGAAEQGTIRVGVGRVIAGFAGGALELRRVQPDGKQIMDATAWMNGRRNEPTTFGADTP